MTNCTRTRAGQVRSIHRCLALGALSLATLAGAAFAKPTADPELTALHAAVEHARSGPGKVEALWALADAQMARGLALEAERSLRQATSLPGITQPWETSLRLGAVLTASGKVDEAREEFKKVDGNVGYLSRPERARLHEAEGALAVRTGDLVGAEKAFDAAAADAAATGSAISEARAHLNALRARLDRRDIAELEDRLVDLGKLVSTLPHDEPSAIVRLALGELFERAVQEFRSPVDLRGRAFEAYTGAAADAKSAATRAYASGLLGALYADEGRNAEALQLTLAAVSLAQSVNAVDQLYRWDWQLGRLERALGDSPASRQAIDRALFTLSGIRGDVLSSSRQAYAARVEPVYLDYADIHLREAAALVDGSPEQQRVLRDVRVQLESLKQAEVQDYFDNGCVISAASNMESINIPGAAVVYPILLADRTEVLIESGGVLRRFSSPVTRAALTATVRRLRLGLEHPQEPDAYRQPAEALYGWLLGPATPWLASQQLDTLVFVPTGPLRTVPLSVLNDGQKFLIERYAIATTPAITLIPTLVAPPASRVLIAGLTKGVQGFDELPSVDTEIRQIREIYPGDSLKDETFSLASIRSDLTVSGYSIAHLATHGEFSADHRQSFILTYDSKFTMDSLQKTLGNRQDPLDLLVLSACSTAAGDDRAALGLAGVAIQSGAKSALASLWSISDKATAVLMDNFYKSRKAGGLTKAQSLRAAQLALLRTDNFRHPSYWAPYLMIGNWL